jgi:hypothetical protein
VSSGGQNYSVVPKGKHGFLMVLGALAAVFAAVMNLKIFMIWAFSSLNSRQAPPPKKKKYGGPRSYHSVAVAGDL